MDKILNLTFSELVLIAFIHAVMIDAILILIGG